MWCAVVATDRGEVFVIVEEMGNLQAINARWRCVVEECLDPLMYENGE